jgi:RNA polymerase sigma-70 factor (ECF subfamily)
VVHAQVAAVKSAARARALEGLQAVSGFRDGDPETHRAVRAVILNVLDGHSPELQDVRDDLVMEITRDLWVRVREAGESIISLERFVARIAHRKAIDEWRRRRRWRYDPDSDGKFALMTDNGPSASEHVQREETIRIIAGLVARADDRTRRIWRLVYFDGLTYREAAGRLGMPEGTLKRLVHESLRWARAQLSSFSIGAVRPGAAVQMHREGHDV